MPIDKVNDILSHQTSQEKAREATSGKRDKVTEQQRSDAKHVSLEDKIIFSEDAKKLQETEMILQNALQQLREMDEVNQQNMAGIQQRIENNFYSSGQVALQVAEGVVPEEHLRATAEKKIVAEKYVAQLSRLDGGMVIDPAKIDRIKANIANGYYDADEVLHTIADNLIEIMDW